MITWRLERTDARLLQGLVGALAVVYPVVAMLPTVEGWLRTKAVTWTSVGSGGAGDVMIAGASIGQLLAALAPALLTSNAAQAGSLVWVIDLSTVAVFVVVGLLILVAAECIAIAQGPADAVELA